MSNKQTIINVPVTLKPKKPSTKPGVTIPKFIKLTRHQVVVLQDYISALEELMDSPTPELHALAKNEVCLQLGLGWRDLQMFSDDAESVGNAFIQRSNAFQGH